MKSIVLASTSPFRKELLGKLRIPFETANPDVDETPGKGEKPDKLAMRLAYLKAAAVASSHPQSLIIGSDQVADIAGEVLGKPGGRNAAIEQLGRLRGQTVNFYTGLCVLDSSSGRYETQLDITSVVFRQLTDTVIERYVDIEKPYNCAGSFKSEALGITLLEKIHGSDPNSLIGLPLIKLVSMLSNVGVSPLEYYTPEYQ